MAEPIKFLNLNVRGLQDRNKRCAVFDYFTLHKGDFVFVQESHSQAENMKIWEREWGGKIIASHGDTNARGVMNMIGNKFNKMSKVQKVSRDKEGRLLICDVNIDDQIYTLINIYGSNYDKEGHKLLETVLKLLIEHECVNIVWGGDFNLVLNSLYDCVNREESHKETKSILMSICEEFDLEDIWRVLNPETKRFTWHKTMKKGGNQR